MKKVELLKLLEGVSDNTEIVVRTIMCGDDESYCSPVVKAYKDYDEEGGEDIFILNPKEVMFDGMEYSEYKEKCEELKKKTESDKRTISLLTNHIRDLKMSLMEYAPKESSYSLNHDEIQKKLDVLNSIEVNETDSDGDGMIYVMVDNTEENIEKLHSIGFTDDDIAESCGVNSFDEIDREEDLDICMLAFRYADFYWYGKFVQSEDVQFEK